MVADGRVQTVVMVALPGQNRQPIDPL